MSLGAVLGIHSEQIAVRDSGRFRAGMLLRFKCGNYVRTGTAEVLWVDAGTLGFSYPLSTLVPSIAVGDEIEEYKRPCERCRCEECERMRDALEYMMSDWGD
jgi:hypothetical protein